MATSDFMCAKVHETMGNIHKGQSRFADMIDKDRSRQMELSGTGKRRIA